MAEINHKNPVASQLHRIGPFATYANEAARLAATGFVAVDVGRVAKQTDTGAYYILTATTPTWQLIGNASTDYVDTTVGDAEADTLEAALFYDSRFAFVRVTFAESPYDVTGTEQNILVDTTDGPVQINAPSPSNTKLAIWDVGNNTQTNAIIWHPQGSELTNGGAGDFTLALNYGTWLVGTDNTDWQIREVPRPGYLTALADEAEAALDAATSPENFVTVDASPYDVTGTDDVLLVDSSAARTINLLAGEMVLVVDQGEASQTNRITLHPPAGGTINGVAADYELAVNGGSWLVLPIGGNNFLVPGGNGFGSLFTTGSLYAGSLGQPAAEADGSLVSVVTTDDDQRGFVGYQYSTDAIGARVITGKAGGTQELPTAVVEGWVTGEWLAEGWDGSGFVASGRVAFVVDGTPSAGVVPVKFVLETNGVARLEVSSAGDWDFQGAQLGGIAAATTSGQVVTYEQIAPALEINYIQQAGPGTLGLPGATFTMADDTVLDIVIEIAVRDTGTNEATWKSAWRYARKSGAGPVQLGVDDGPAPPTHAIAALSANQWIVPSVSGNNVSVAIVTTSSAHMRVVGSIWTSTISLAAAT